MGTAPFEINIVFEKEVISHSNNTRLSKPFNTRLKAHKVVQQGCFFFNYSLLTSMTNAAQISKERKKRGPKIDVLLVLCICFCLMYIYILVFFSSFGEMMSSFFL